MSKKSLAPAIRLRGVRHNNLKNFNLDLPLNRLIVVTGLSGSEKSSLAFDTLFAEGQRRYIETFSPYARQFFDRMDKPQVDSIEGIPPAIAIEQRNSVKTTRSTVGTMTEICDYMKLLWPHVAQLHCRQCGRAVRKDSPQQIWETIVNQHQKSVYGMPRSEDAAYALNEVPFPLTPALSPNGGEGEKNRADIATATVHVPQSPVRPRSILRTSNGDSMSAAIRNPQSAIRNPTELLITFSIPISEKLSLDESLALINKQGYQRLLLDGEILRLDEAIPQLRKLKPGALTIVQDRVKPVTANRARFIEACEQAYHFGKGKLAVYEVENGSSENPQSAIRNPQLYSNRLHCAACDIEYREPSSALFSFNHPVGACPACRGFGRIISIDYNLALPDRAKTLAEGVVKPWQSGQSAECQDDLMKFCRIRKAPTDVPFQDLPKKWQDWVIEGDAGYGKDAQHQWPRAWYGIKGYFRWLESKAYKMHVRVLLSRYRSYTPCPDCHGKRFQPESLLYKVKVDLTARKGSTQSEIRNPKSSIEMSLADFYQMPVRDAFRFIEQLGTKYSFKPSDPIGLVLGEVRSRLGFLNEVGLGYLTLDRPTRSLSGGETERVNLTTCLGTRLVNTLFVLDEPSVGLHPRDTSRLVRILEQLRSAGNTVVVVEHEASVMRAADQIVDIGPGHGAAGGEIIFQGPYQEILKADYSLTGEYLSGRRKIEIPARRPVHAGRNGEATPTLKISHATMHNLKGLTVEIPLGRFVCLTGVSGSGKSTLARDILLPLLTSKFKVQSLKSENGENGDAGQEETDVSETSAENGTSATPSVADWESLGRVVLVDQSILAKTPRSNPAVYIGAFDDIRELFAQSDLAQQRGLGASAFSFNSSQGQCERCRGAGFEKIEMQFLSDIFIRCPECNGRRYRQHILEIKLDAPASGDELRATPSSQPSPPVGEKVPGGRLRGSPGNLNSSRKGNSSGKLSLSIADLLDATVDEAVDFLSAFGDSRHAKRAVASIKLLQEVGLGYLRLGQPINTLSGGESQRLKLVRHLADFTLAGATDSKPTLFLFDEPTTGLHFDDVRVLLQVFQRLVDAGHSVLIIEHNLDVIKSADWVIDLGPDAGDEGGRVVVEGTPEAIAQCAASHTGRALKEILPSAKKTSRVTKLVPQTA